MIYIHTMIKFQSKICHAFYLFCSFAYPHAFFCICLFLSYIQGHLEAVPHPINICPCLRVFYIISAALISTAAQETWAWKTDQGPSLVRPCHVQVMSFMFIMIKINSFRFWISRQLDIFVEVKSLFNNFNDGRKYLKIWRKKYINLWIPYWKLYELQLYCFICIFVKYIILLFSWISNYAT